MSDSITCPRCMRVSFHPKDIIERYCGHCHMFHNDPRCKRAQALIQWLDSTVGGRKGTIPFTDIENKHFYCVPAKFQGWQAEVWSLYVELRSSFDMRAGLYRGEVWFLAENAPVEVLQPEAQFALYEGTRIVAVGKCI